MKTLTFPLRYSLRLTFLAKKRLFKNVTYLIVFGLVIVLYSLYPKQENGQDTSKLIDEHATLRRRTAKDNEIQQVLQSLENGITDTDYGHMFKGKISDKNTWEFDFSNIAKRRFGRSYHEFTSADPDGRNGDFFNPITVHGRSTVIFEDYGPGILKRMLLHCRKPEFLMDIANYVIIAVDGERLFMQETTERRAKRTNPFKEPFFRASKKRPGTGYVITFPVAYRKHIRIISEFNKGPEFDDVQAWNTTYHCKRDNTYCPLVCYFAVTIDKLVHGTKLNTTFADFFLRNTPQIQFLKQVTNAVSLMARSPEVYGLGKKSSCQLTCQKVSSGQEIAIYSAKNTPGVVQSIFFRVYDVQKKTIMSTDWKTMLISMTWDGKAPQVKEIPLAGFFTNGFDYVREVRSLNAGVRLRACDMSGDHASEMKARDWLAYLFYDMPFWSSAKITIKRVPGIVDGVICTNIRTKPLDINEYNPRLTGYFSAQLNQQVFGTKHNKILLKLENQWGHVVALNFFLKNTKVPDTQEYDVIIELDQANAPTISGTGMEDYFDYVHTFANYINTTSVFNGVPYFAKAGTYRLLRCYRHMTLDPILFTSGILMYLEGYSDRTVRKVYRKFGKTLTKFTRNNEPDSLLSVVLYYGNKGNGGITSDLVHYKDFKKSPSNFEFDPPDVENFLVHAAFENQPHILFDRIVVSMQPGQTVVHVFNISINNVGVILRREYRTIVPNQRAQVEVDDEEAGVWFCPQRALSEQCSLRLHDYHLSPHHTVEKESIKVKIKALTRWETISIKVMSIVLTD